MRNIFFGTISVEGQQRVYHLGRIGAHPASEQRDKANAKTRWETIASGNLHSEDFPQMSMKLAHSLAIIFQRLRQSKRLSIRDVAKKSRVSPATISRFERGGEITLSRLDKIYKSIGCSIVWTANPDETLEERDS